MSKKKMSKSQRFSKKAYERKKRQKRERSKKESKRIEKQERLKKEKAMRTEIKKIMDEGRNAGITYKDSKKNVTDRTHQNNISAVSGMFKELKIYKLDDLNNQKIKDYFEEQKRKFENGDIKKGGLVNNRIKGLKRFYDSAKIAKGLQDEQKERFLKKNSVIEDLNDWKNEEKIVKSKKSSSFLKPSAKQQKAINDRFTYLRKSNPKDEKIKLASDYHKFASATGARINQGINATLENLKKIDGKYLYVVGVNQDKTKKARTKIIENKNDIKFLDRLVEEAKERADKNGHAYLFEMKENGDSLSRQKVKWHIGDVYREKFKNFTQTTFQKVRGKKELYEVEQNFVPHSSRSIAIHKELKTRALRYKRDLKEFERDLEEMIRHDNSRGHFNCDSRGAVAYGYDHMKKKLKRELTIREKAMYLASVAAGHNRIDVIRDHYLSDDLNDWFKEKGM